jgi:hypothetical protein
MANDCKDKDWINESDLNSKHIILTPKRYKDNNGMYGFPVAKLTITRPNDKIVCDLIETLLDAGFTIVNE